MISSQAREEGVLGGVWLGGRPSLCPLKTAAGGVGGWGGLQVRNHQYWCFQKQHKTSLFWPSPAVVSRGVLSARGGGACMAACMTPSHGGVPVTVRLSVRL